MVVKISPSGEVLSSLMDRHGETVFTVSAVTEFGGKLWLGNLAGDFVSVVDLEKVGKIQLNSIMRSKAIGQQDVSLFLQHSSASNRLD